MFLQKENCHKNTPTKHKERTAKLKATKVNCNMNTTVKKEYKKEEEKEA